MHADTRINARWIIPIRPANTVHEHHALIIHDEQIVDILPQAEADQRYQSEHIIDLNHHALLPGFINAHTHAAMSLFRGLADDLPLMTWLNDHIWPAEAKWVNPEFVHAGTRLAVAEMLMSGTTCFNDMYFFPDQSAEVAVECGMRISVGLILIDFPTAWASDAQNYIDKGLEVHDKFRHNALVSSVFAPHAPYTVSDEPLKHVLTLAEELDVPIHMHVHETGFEVTESQNNLGLRPLQRLQDLGLLSQRLMAVHMTQLSTEEIDTLGTFNVNVVHCPESNLKLASGFCPVGKLQAAGINVALGTDGAASNNDLDMLGEMRSAALLAKAVAEDPTVLTAFQTLEMATINGARALGLDDTIGTLEKGKQADMVAIDLSTVNTQPLYDPVSQIVYAAGRDQVTHVWVAGRNLLNDKELTNLDLQQCLSEARNWQQKISNTNAD